ncbi:hypothetical protein ACHAWF_009813 [Thalassiosira exigua]
MATTADGASASVAPRRRRSPPPSSSGRSGSQDPQNRRRRRRGWREYLFSCAALALIIAALEVGPEVLRVAKGGGEGINEYKPLVGRGGPRGCDRPFFPRVPARLTRESVPRDSRDNKRPRDEDSSTSHDYNDLYTRETEECKLSDPSYQTKLAAPSTCNDVHALGYRFGPTKRSPIAGVKNVYSSRHSIKYLTSGGYRDAWTATMLDGGYVPEEKRVILKTNKLSRSFSLKYLDQNRRDVLIMERAGRYPLFDGSGERLHGNATQQTRQQQLRKRSRRRLQSTKSRSHVLPVYQYCAFSMILPFADAGDLETYMKRRSDFLTAEEIYALALQAARGIRDMQVFKEGKATHVHADVKPAQFLLYESPHEGDVPLMLVDDFNRGKFLTRSVETDETCSFRMCGIRHNGNPFRGPEEYMECGDASYDIGPDQSDRIDVYALGGILYYLLADGDKPWYYVPYDKAMEAIMNGKRSRLPRPEEYEREKEGGAKFVAERARNPLYRAVKRAMEACWAYKPEERPDAAAVVRMLEKGGRGRGS